MLVPLGGIALEHAQVIIKIIEKAEWLLGYTAFNPLATIRYTASGMILYIHSDVLYLSVLMYIATLGVASFSGTPLLIQQNLPLYPPHNLKKMKIS